MRGINSRFVSDLTDGCLSWFLAQVKMRNDLALEIRENYINIYYKGGNALRIRQKKRDYRFGFDEKYCLDDATRMKVGAFQSLDDYRDNFELLLSEMDNWFQHYPKGERKIQHDLIKLNTSDFCILDIEYAGSYVFVGKRKSFRIDMIAIYDGKIVLIENKNGEKAMGQKAGIAAHYSDMCAIIDNPTAKASLIQSAKNIAESKKALGLPFANITGADMEILFIIFNRNERSKALDSQLATINKRHPAKIIYMDAPDKIQYEKAQILYACAQLGLFQPDYAQISECNLPLFHVGGLPKRKIFKPGNNAFHQWI